MGGSSRPDGHASPRLRDLAPRERLGRVAQIADLSAEDRSALGFTAALSEATADGMIENVVGAFELPLGVAENFVVNGKPYLVPMAVEEPSVVAAASHMAKMAAQAGGFTASSDAPVMRGQIQVLDVPALEAASEALGAHEAEILAAANACDPVLVELGGGATALEVHSFPDTPVGPMLVVHLLVDVRDAMGANAVNSMAEALAPTVERLTGGRVRLRILSNLADKRLARASVRLPVGVFDKEHLNGAEVAKGIAEAGAFAEVDPYRAATHNKGIMNGIDPVVVATGNDWRAIEAGAHAFAARSGRYSALTRWVVEDGALVGEIELPMAVGLVGGATRTHPAAQAALRLMRIESAAELGQVIAAVGLAQNLGALRALATEGIQRGHMALHARNIAITAGAQGARVDEVAAQMAREGAVSVARAKELLA